MGKSGYLIIALLGLLIGQNHAIIGQSNSLPPSEARRAIEALEREPIIQDSLMRVYAGKWTLGFNYGLRFIGPENQTDQPDTITFADFNDSRSVFGLQLGRFMSSRFHLELAMEILVLPREQEIQNVQFNSGGIDVEAQGNGGAMLNWGIRSKYYFVGHDKLTRPYVSALVGVLNAKAVGGEGGFSSTQGQFNNMNEITERYGYLQTTLGITHRVSPASMFNFNMGYTIANRSDPIGGITSPGGFTTNVSLLFILGINKD